jgi:MFS family permease
MPHLSRYVAPAGLVIMTLALGLSSFSQTTTHLILSQGLAYGIGAGLVYYPLIVYINEWFVHKRGFALGIMWVRLGKGLYHAGAMQHLMTMNF